MQESIVIVYFVNFKKMSNGYWLKLSKGNILKVMELMALHPKDETAMRTLKELNYCLKQIEKTEFEHKAIFGSREGKTNCYKTNSFIRGLEYAKQLFEGNVAGVIQKEIDRFLGQSTKDPDRDNDQEIHPGLR